MPGCSGGPVVTNARVYYTPRAAAGASAPGIPHALLGGRFLNDSDAIAPRDREALSRRHCEELLRRSNPALAPGSTKLDCFRLRSLSYGGHVPETAIRPACAPTRWPPIP